MRATGHPGAPGGRGSCRRGKAFVAATLDRLQLLRLRERDATTVVAVNYHGTPASLSASLGEHFAFYREHFESLDEQGLLDFLDGRRTLRRPGLIVSFDDGFADHGAVAAPLLDRYGLTGWFFVPGGFVDTPVEQQPEFCRRHIRSDYALEHSDASMYAMTWESVRGLAARGHVIGGHTWSHVSLGPGTSNAVIDAEVLEARRRLEERVERPVRVFCWVRGGVGDYCADAFRAVGKEHRLAFMGLSSVIRRETNPLTLYRFSVEASWPLPVVRFQLSRFNEAWFRRRRAMVERTLGLA